MAPVLSPSGTFKGLDFRTVIELGVPLNRAGSWPRPAVESAASGRHRRVQEVLITQSSVRSAFSQPAAAAERDTVKTAR